MISLHIFEGSILQVNYGEKSKEKEKRKTRKKKKGKKWMKRHYLLSLNCSGHQFDYVSMVGTREESLKCYLLKSQLFFSFKLISDLTFFPIYLWKGERLGN
jgi:hypothetical protein